MRQDQRQTLLDKSRDLVTINSVPIHDSNHPQILDTCEVFLVEVGILIDFPHLWNESSSCLMGDPFYHLLHWPFSLVLKLDWFDVGSPLQRHGFLVLPYVDPSEVRGLILEVKHANLVRIPRRAAAVWQLSCPFKMLNIATFLFGSSMVVPPAALLFAHRGLVDDIFKVDSVRYAGFARRWIDLD